MARQTRAKMLEREEILRELRERVFPIDPRLPLDDAELQERRRQLTVYCILRSVSRSGMSRTITLYVIRDGEPHYITHDVAKVLDWPLTKDGNLRVDGCGMDMGFHTVYNLSGALFGHHDRGGYVLTHRWM